MNGQVVVAGASFAGLAVAQAFGGPLVVLDPLPLGAGQTSACGAPLSVIERAGAAGAVQQVHRQLVLHTVRREFAWELGEEPFCTFDYRRFCQLAWERTQAELVRASAWAFDGRWVHTSAGRLRAEVVVDCTGWRAKLLGGRGGRGRWFGLETEVRARWEAGLHFFFWPEVVEDGYAWAFPCGEGVRFGVLSYRGRTRLRDRLDRFVSRFGLRAGTYHGGFLGVGPTRAGAGRVFAVGDSAGCCLPLTGEGIRSALHAGWLVGSLLGQVARGVFPLEDARARYEAYLAAQRRSVAFLAAATWLVLHLPQAVLDGVVAAWSHGRRYQAFLRRYMDTFPPPEAVH